jgi:hypothetical protein
MNLTAVTATCDRPEAFMLCQIWMSRQTKVPMQWIVLDDGLVRAHCVLGQEYMHFAGWRGPWSLSQKISHLCSSGMVKGDGIVFFEDDDWYSPKWLEFCDHELEQNALIGEGNAIYYNVTYRKWFGHGNMGHASLCSTAIRTSELAGLGEQCKDPNPFVDSRIWARLNCTKRVVNNDPNKLVVGIKGMPGTPGYGSGHGYTDPNSRNDFDMVRLKELVGEDYKLYATFWNL